MRVRQKSQASESSLCSCGEAYLAAWLLNGRGRIWRHVSGSRAEVKVPCCLDGGGKRLVEQTG